MIESAIAVGEFLLAHGDVIEEIARALAGGTPKDAIIAAIRGAQVEVSDDAIADELHAAALRRAAGKS